MIAQNDALDETKKLGYQKKFRSTKKIAFFVSKWPFLAKNFKFWPKMAIFFGPKIFKNFFFVFFYILDHSSSCLMKTKKLAPFGPFLAPFGPLSPYVW